MKRSELKEAIKAEIKSVLTEEIQVGDIVTLQGKQFTIKGFNTRARKSPINIEDAQGRGYKCSVDMLKMYNPA